MRYLTQLVEAGFTICLALAVLGTSVAGFAGAFIGSSPIA